MEIDGSLEVVPVSEATSAFLYCGDFRVQPFRNSIGDAMSEVGQDVGQMPRQELGLLDHGPQAAMRRPEIPLLPEALRAELGAAVPHFPQRFFERPGARRFQVVALDLVESFTRRFRQVFRAVQPQVFAALEPVVALFQQVFVFLLAHFINALTDMLHDVESVKHHLVIGLRNVFPARADIQIGN